MSNDPHEELQRERHERRNADALATKRTAQLQALQEIGLGLLGQVKEKHIFDVLTQAVVHRLKWDGAVVIQIGKTPQLRSHFHLTEQQRRILHAELDQLPTVLESYAHRDTVSTIGKNDAMSLALRIALHTDEVIGAPLTIGKRRFGYLLVCSHTKRNEKRDYEDIRFLAAVVSLAGRALEVAHHPHKS